MFRARRLKRGFERKMARGQLPILRERRGSFQSFQTPSRTDKLFEQSLFEQRDVSSTVRAHSKPALARKLKPPLRVPKKKPSDETFAVRL